MVDKEEKTPLVVPINEDESDVESFDTPSAPPSSSLGDRQRLKYYYSLQKSHGIKFAVPESFLPPELWVRGINPTPRSSQIYSKEALKFGGDSDSPTPALPDNKQSSLITIFSIVNTMLGSSLLSIPWAFTQSGFGTGIGTVLFVGIICFYTAYLIVKNSEGEDDFSQICKIYLGQFGYVLSIICSILVLVGAAIAYDIIMSHSLYDLVDGIKELATGRDDPSALYKHWWNDHTVPIIIVIVLFPLLNLKEFVVLVKLNTVGILSILYLLFFIPFVSLYKRDIQVTKVAQFEGKFYYLAGIMTLAFFIHNCVVSILKNNRHQKHNARDLSIAYVIVAFTYCLVGASGFLGYGNVAGGMPQDFLKLLATTQPLSLVARAFVVIQLLSVYPLILFIIRLQFFGFFWKKAYPGFFHVLILNLFLAATTTLFAMFFPKIGEVLRFTGAFCGLVYVFILPIGVHWRKQKQKNKLSAWSIISHSFLLLLGLASLVSQFL